PAGSGSFTATVSNNAYATASPSGNGFDLTTGAGTDNAVVLDFSGNADVTSSAGNGVVIDASTIGAGSLTITGFSGNSVNGATTGAGIVISNVTFDATPGGALDQVSGGVTVIGSGADAVGGAGMSLNSVTGDLAFTTLNIDNATGIGLKAVGTGSFTGMAGFRITTGAGSTIDSDAGPALDLDPLTAALTLDTINASGASGGVALTDVDGTVDINGGAISHSGGNGFLVDGSNAAVSYDGTITSMGGTAVDLQNRTGGSVTFNGAVTAFNNAAGVVAAGNSGGSATFAALLGLASGTNSAVSLNGNSGATFNFNGGLDIDTTTGIGFSAINQGTLNVTGSNTVDTTAAQAFNLDTMVIGGSGMTFSRVAAANTGNAAGVVADSVSGGSLTVTNLQVNGTGTANGVNLLNNTSTMTFGAASSIQNAGGTAFNVSGGTSNITYIGDISNTAGLSVAVNNTTAGLVNLSGTTTVTDSGDGISITSASNVTVAKANLSSGAVVDINSGSSGAAYTFSDLQMNHTAGVNNAIDVDGGQATVSITANSTNNIISTTNRVLRVVNTAGGSVTVNTGAGTLTDNGGGGIEIANADSAVTVNNGDLNGTQGISIANAASGAMTFNNVTVDVGGSAFIVNGSPGDVTSAIDLNNVDITNPGARVADIQNMNGGSVDFDAASTLSTTSGTGIIVNSLAGTVPVAFNGPVDLGTGTGNRLSSQALTMSGNSAGTTVTFANLDVFTNNADGIDASGSGTLNATVGALNSAGTGYNAALDLTGILSGVSVSDLDCSNNSNCVDLTSLAATSTTSFDDVNLTSTGGTAFNASSARTVTVTDADNDNTISATNAVGAILTSTTIGGAGVTFHSISSSGASNGIMLNTTGSSGTFEVRGDGASSSTVSVGTRGRTLNLNGGGMMSGLGTGGVITNTSGDGVSLNSTVAVLRNMTIGDSAATAGQAADTMTSIGDDGISASNVSSLTLDNLLISRTATHGIRGSSLSNVTILNTEVLNAGTAIDEDAVNFTELLGVSTITNSVFDGMHSQGISVFNDTRTSAVVTDDLTIQNSQVSNSDAIAGEIGIQFESELSSNFSLVVLDSLIETVEGNGIGVFSGGNNAAIPSNAHLEVQRTTINGAGSPDIKVPTAIQVNPSFEGNSTFDIRNNNATDGGGFFNIPTAGIIIKNDSNGLLRGTIDDTTVTSGGEGAFVVADGAIGMTNVTGDIQITVSNNTFTSSNAHGMLFSAQDGAVGLEAKIGGNTTTAGGPAFSFQNGIFMDVQSGTACFNLSTGAGAGNNVATGAGSGEGIFLQKTGGSVDFQGFGGGNDAAASTFLNNNNTSNPAAFVFSGDTVGTGSCTNTP
ncbi:MAG TPA: right-handed parallel beta-helix repeat-containing protein, partial [Acidobacteriota bacterium]|nr:right-handed parallel beta-helix repeat-containing protein [Acidobacteriota bacterium]